MGYQSVRVETVVALQAVLSVDQIEVFVLFRFLIRFYQTYLVSVLSIWIHFCSSLKVAKFVENSFDYTLVKIDSLL